MPVNIKVYCENTLSARKKFLQLYLPMQLLVLLLVLFLGSLSSLPAADMESFPLAIGGMDPVSYFRSGEPRSGDPEILVEFEGCTWLFAEEENLRMFLASPDSYLPAFLGYGAYAASRESLLKGNPNIWLLQDGRLLFFRTEGAKRRWDEDPQRLWNAALSSWPTLENQMKLRGWRAY